MYINNKNFNLKTSNCNNYLVENCSWNFIKLLINYPFLILSKNFKFKMTNYYYLNMIKV